MAFQQIGANLLLFALLIVSSYSSEEDNQILQKRLETLEAQNGEILQQLVGLAAMVSTLQFIRWFNFIKRLALILVSFCTYTFLFLCWANRAVRKDKNTVIVTRSFNNKSIIM